MSSYEHFKIVEGNQYIDDLLRKLTTKYKSRLHPYILWDTIKSFQRKMIFPTGELRLLTGFIAGLETLSRIGKSYMMKKIGTVHATSRLGAGDLHSRFQMITTFMQCRFLVTVDVSISFIEAFTYFSFNIGTGKDFIIHELQITDLRGLRIEVCNLRPLNKIINIVLNVLLWSFPNFVRKQVEDQLKRNTMKIIRAFQLPMQMEKCIYL
ncbi:uncharacterized protein TNIN_436641 [Trichonephila inaurata madagascariensis]|uniref:Uncharacterized protein n=1 Tax=Trichonephila inaurata madagascariensis TaxID=2747483 RepID=A0A8X6XNI1_9ARAC|nr:uncharacterized protein TNIN_436641 [Trichonephila inaurata madagascariensis]